LPLLYHGAETSVKVLCAFCTNAQLSTDEVDTQHRYDCFHSSPTQVLRKARLSRKISFKIVKFVKTFFFAASWLCVIKNKYHKPANKQQHKEMCSSEKLPLILQVENFL
jgi:hypothetical protein